MIRQHWGLENQLHWNLDVTWREDRCPIRSDRSPRNFALLRRMALNALHQETTLKRSSTIDETLKSGVILVNVPFHW